MAIKKIVILGTGGNCIDILDTINEINRFEEKPKYECVGFLDDNKEVWGKSFFDTKVLGPLDYASNLPKSYYFINGIGSPSNFWKKEEIINKTKILLSRFETIIHPTASVSKMAKIGKGNVILQNVTISSNVMLGDHIIILPNSVISHDDIIGDYTSLAGGVCISGNVRIGKFCYLGSNCSIIDGIIISDYCLIGMGSVVISNIERNSVVAGCPAKFLRDTK